jgi:2-methylisocitrate lyase-like PEP mutase family enzyme
MHESNSHEALAARRKAFRVLHERGCFVISNPSDVGSARYLQHLGFRALATTSAGFAFSQGSPDSGDDAVISRDRNLAYIASIAAAVDLPVSADFMSAYGLEPEDVAESVTRCVAAGVAGLSIEDATGDASSPLYDLPIAAERVRRLQAYVAAGADVLFAPGPQTLAEIEALVAAVAPRPFNLLVVRDIGLRVEDRGARRPTHQRWRRAGIGGVDRLHARRSKFEVRWHPQDPSPRRA